MDKSNIYEALQPEKLKTWLKTAFAEAGITTVEVLKNDNIIEKAAVLAYERIPLIPFRGIIKATMGKNGFTKLVFHIRDKMLELNTLDLSWLNLEYLKSILFKITKDKSVT